VQVDRDEIEAGLPKKGFIRQDSRHRYFYHEYQGKRTGAYTYTSHGSGYKVYGDALLKMMRTQLRLDTARQVVDLAMCPLSQTDYEKILKDKGVIEEESDEGK